jgi:hypothetical protein
MLANHPLTWSSRMQDRVSLSFTAAEYIACSTGVKFTIWTRQFLNDLPPTVRMQSLPILYAGDEAPNMLSKNHAFYRRTHHFNHKYHYVRQEGTCPNLEIMGISRKYQLVDPLTKHLPMNYLKACKEKIGLIPPARNQSELDYTK